MLTVSTFSMSLTVRRNGGRMKSPKDTKQLTFRAPEDMLAHLKEQAEKNFRSVNAELLARLARTMEQDKAGDNDA